MNQNCYHIAFECDLDQRLNTVPEKPETPGLK